MTKGKVIGVISNLLMIEVDGPATQNEICLINAGKWLKAEVIRVRNNRVSAQLFESSYSIQIGAEVQFTGHMLEVELGPGVLSRKYDGLQSDLERMTGTFIEIGDSTDPLDYEELYMFSPLAKKSDHVTAGSWIGYVKENNIDHKIMVPISWKGRYKVVSVATAGSYRLKDVMATVEDEGGKTLEVTMVQRWPVKVPLTGYSQKLRPGKIFQTGFRVIDTLNPLMEGGTGYIPGPFGTGKTVLQQAIAKNSEADILIVVACGERANEVVEIFSEFPKLIDPVTGHKLDEKTIIICNTSNMPVAAREASVYVGMTLAEYYRCMGYKVLLLADSTSRWAQALREMSNRMEELPGQDAFPVDLPSTIANFYSRAGIVKLGNGQLGSVTFIGTISPAGGNFKEPVTESTSKVARCFYALSQKRADSKRYPAIDPLASYSKYIDYPEFAQYSDTHIQKGWVQQIKLLKNYLRVGLESRDQILILGDDAVPLDYHVSFWKSELIDFGIIQQNSYDPIDMRTDIERQRYMLNFILEICTMEFKFKDFEEVRTFFKNLINRVFQMNFTDFQSESFRKYEEGLRESLPDKAEIYENQSIS
ncbi:V-type ATP synthase subunit A [Marinoscillum pacificum]|uniref:V-type ATP synthase subunit A n=1 Tax=Marinoscillum pacificum TaxID=392723 RepID=UPI00215765D7|nr:V-type ATP synthase subunit A [Marinoscillum pacificum]